MTRNGTLSERKAKFLQAYLSTPTVTEAARVAGVSRRVAHRYLADAELQAALRAMQDERLRHACACISEAMSEAVVVLRGVMNDPEATAATRANAAARLLDGGMRLTELVTLSGRLDELEKQLGGTQ